MSTLPAIRILRPTAVATVPIPTADDVANIDQQPNLDPITLANEFDRTQAIQDVVNQLIKIGYSDITVKSIALDTVKEVVQELAKEALQLKELYEKAQGQEMVVFQLCDGTETDGYPGLSVVLELEKEGLSFTGADSDFYETTISKPVHKRLLQSANVATANFFEFWSPPKDLQELDQAIQTIGFPMIVKPSVSYASINISLASVVHDAQQLMNQIRAALEATAQSTLVPVRDGYVGQESQSQQQETLLFVPKLEQETLQRLEIIDIQQQQIDNNNKSVGRVDDSVMLRIGSDCSSVVSSPSIASMSPDRDRESIELMVRDDDDAFNNLQTVCSTTNLSDTIEATGTIEMNDAGRQSASATTMTTTTTTTTHDTPTVFVETYLAGREFTALVVGDKHFGVTVYPVAERAFPAHLGKFERLLTFEEYWDGYDLEGNTPENEQELCQYRLAPQDWQERLQQIAKDAYLALNGNGYGRVDIRTYTEDECEPVVLEVNANCGLSFEKDSSSLGNILLMANIDPPGFVQGLVDHAIHRQKTSRD